jgi:hypothetical protein
LIGVLDSAEYLVSDPAKAGSVVATLCDSGISGGVKTSRAISAGGSVDVSLLSVSAKTLYRFDGDDSSGTCCAGGNSGAGGIAVVAVVGGAEETGGFAGGAGEIGTAVVLEE